MSDRVYFSLDSLPQLIGERQFKMLCEALGIDDALADAKENRRVEYRFDAGAFAAQAIERMARQKRADRQPVPQAFEGMPE
jgi:hypothetical protein